MLSSSVFFIFKFFPWHENFTLNLSPCDWKDWGIMGPGKHICVKVHTHFRFNWGFNISFCMLSHNDNHLMAFSWTLRDTDWWLMPRVPFIFIYKASDTITVGALQNLRVWIATSKSFKGQKKSLLTGKKKPWAGPWSYRVTLLLMTGWVERKEKGEERNRHINHICKNKRFETWNAFYWGVQGLHCVWAGNCRSDLGTLVLVSNMHEQANTAAPRGLGRHSQW